MLSKNNFQERLRKMEPKKDRFSIRKFTIGAVSVLIGSVFFAMGGQQAKAEVTPANKDDNTKANEESNASSEQSAAQKDIGQVQSEIKTDQIANEAGKLANSNGSLKDKQDAARAINKKTEDLTAQEKADLVNKVVAKKKANQTTTPKADSKAAVPAAKDTDSAKKKAGQRPQKTTPGADSIERADLLDKDIKTLSDEKIKTNEVDAKLNATINNKPQVTLEDIKNKEAEFEKNAASMTDEQRQQAANDLKAMTEKLSAADQFALANGSYAETPGIGGKQYDYDAATKTVTINGFWGLSRAILDKNVNTIKLANSIDISNMRAEEADQVNKDGYYGLWAGNGTALADHELGAGHPALSLGDHGQFKGIARDLTIDGQGNSLTMGKWYISFRDHGGAANSNNYDGGKKWNLVLKDMTLNTDATADGHGPFFFNVSQKNADNTTLTFDGVTANVKNSELVDNTGTGVGSINVVFKSSDNKANNINVTLPGSTYSAVVAKNVNLAKNAILNINVTNPTVKNNASGNMEGNDAFYLGLKGKGDRTATLENPSSHGNFTVGKNAQLTFNANTVVLDKDGNITKDNRTTSGVHNMRFMYNQNPQGGNYVQEAGSNVKLYMGDGHSVAIHAGNLKVDQSANLYINTLQNNNKNYTELAPVGSGASQTHDGWHWAPISLDMLDTQAGDTHPLQPRTKEAVVNGTVKIVRGIPGQNIETVSPLISFGSSSTNESATFNFTVGKGATLDLQDNSNSSYDTGSMFSKGMQWIGSKGDVNFIGLISIWGTGSTDNVLFDNPQYINLQRTGTQVGNTLRVEGLKNNIIIKNSETKGTPLAQWMGQNRTDTPDEAWRISQIKGQSAGGDNFSNFLPSGAKAGDKGGTFFDISGFLKKQYMGAPFDKSNGTAGMAPFLGDYQFKNGSYMGQSMAGVHGIGLTQLTNNFNWWGPRRITIGENPSIKFLDSTNFEPETQIINKTTNDKVADLNTTDLQKGIKDLLDSNNTVAQDHATILGADSKIDWANSSWGLDWSKTDFTEDGHLRKNPSATLTTAQQNMYNALKRIASVAPAQDEKGNFVPVPEGFNYKVATITYKDNASLEYGHSVDFVFVPIKVLSQADMYDPQGQNIETKVNDPEQKVKPENAISNKSGDKAVEGIKNLPSDANYAWVDQPDVTKPGVVPSIVKVTYSDGSIDTVPVNVKVTDDKGTVPEIKTEADLNDPKGKDQDTVIGKVPDAVNSIDWQGKTPKDKDGNVITPTYKWANEPNVYTKGSHPGVVEVTYPDGSKDLVPANVNVTNSPTGTPQVVKQGSAVPDAQSSIDWTNDNTQPNGKEPANATYTWVSQPDVSVPGKTTGIVQITYPDGETTDAVVPVTVTEDDSTFNPYAKNLNLPYNPEGKGYPEAKDVVEFKDGVSTPNGIKEGTTIDYSWVQAPDTKTPGVQSAEITATYKLSDGTTTQKDIPVVVTVGPMSDYYNPTASDLTVNKGEEMSGHPANAQISFNGETPKDKTTDVWAPEPVISVVGTQPSMIKVTYKDGSSDYVPLNVTVKATDADQFKAEYKGKSVEEGKSVTIDKPTLKHEDGTALSTDDKVTAPYKAISDTPSWATVNSDGSITINQAPTAGAYNIPVEVDYNDNSSEVTYAPLAVTKNDGSKTTWPSNDISATISTAVDTYHKTSGDSKNDPKADTAVRVQKISRTSYATKTPVTITYEYDATSGKYVLKTPGVKDAAGEDAPATIDADQITTVWEDGFKANTNTSNFIDVDKAKAGYGTATSLASDQYGDPSSVQRTQSGNLAGNSKARVNITFGTEAQKVFGLAADQGWCNAFANYLGATKKADADAITVSGPNGFDDKSVTDKLGTLVDHTDLDSLTGNQAISDYAWGTKPTVANGKVTDGGAVRINFKDGTYLDIPVDADKINYNNQASLYTPSYKSTDVQAGETATADPTIKNGSSDTVNVPDGTTFTTNEGTPTWATINGNTGIITLKPGETVSSGAYNVPVTVTYKDGSKDTVNAPVIVTDKNGDQTVTWGDNGAVVVTTDPSAVKVHETSDKTQVIDASDAIKSINSYKIDSNGTIATTPVSIDKSKVTASWSTPIDTTVTTATAAGKTISGESVKVDLGNQADDVLGNVAKTVTTKTFDITAAGAEAKDNSAKPIEIKLGSDLTSDQFSSLVNNKIPSDEIASTAWKTKPTKTDDGVITITFKDKNGDNPTYLDVTIPAKNMKVTGDDDTFDPKGKPTTIKQSNDPNAVPDAKDSIDPSSITGVPDGTKYSWTDNTKTPDPSKPGIQDVEVTVTYPDGTQDKVPTTVTVNATPTTKPIRIDEGDTNPDPTPSITNVNNGGTEPTPGYPTKVTWTDGKGPDTKTPGKQEVSVTVTYPDPQDPKKPGKTETTTVTVVVTEKPKTQPITVNSGQTPDVTKTVTNIDPSNPGKPSKVEWTDGNVPDTTNPGVTNPSITVTYPNIEDPTKPGETITTTVPLIVVDPTNQSVVQNDKGAVIVTTNDVTTHKTTDTNAATDATATAAIKSVDTYTFDKDGKLVKNENSSTTGVTAKWDDLNTQSDDTTSVAKTGHNLIVTFGSDSDAAKAGIVNDGDTTKTPAQVTIMGAKGNSDIAVNVNDAVPTTGLDQYLSNKDAGSITGATLDWKTKPGTDGKFDAIHTSGVLEYKFNDGTYLDVPVSFSLNSKNYIYGSWVTVQDPENPKNNLSQEWYSKKVSYTDKNNIPSAQLDDVKLPDVPSYYIPKVISLKGAPAAKIVQKEDGTYLQFPTVNSNHKENDYYVRYTDSREYVQEHLDVYGPNNFTDSSDPHTAEGGYWGTVSRTEIKKGDDGKYPITNVPTQNINDLVKKDIFTNDKTGAKGQTLPEEWTKQGYIPIITAATTEGSHAHGSAQSEMLTKLNNYIKSHPMCTTLPNFKAEVPMDVHFVVHYVKPINYTPAQKDDDGSYIDDSMNYDSTRYIYVHDVTDPNSVRTIEQDVHFSRNVNGYSGYVGANGVTIWNPWKLDPANQEGWAEYTIPPIAGYESRLDTRDNRDDVNTIPSEAELSKPVTKVDRIEIGTVNEWTSQTNPVFDANGDYSDGYNSPKEEDVYYTAKDQKTTVTYVDDKGNEIKMPNGSAVAGSHYTLSGKTGEQVDTNIETNVPKNWQLVGDQTINPKITFTANGHDPIKVQVEHKTEQVSPKEDDSDSYRKITQTIYETIPSQIEPQKARESYVVYTRTGSKDLVTNETTWGTWTPAVDKETQQPVTSFDKFDVTRSGYTAKSDQVTISTDDGKQYVPTSNKITEDSNDQNIYVTYDANEHTAKINYVDNSDKKTVIGSQDVKGKTGETVTVTTKDDTSKLEVPAGWQIVSPQDLPGTITFGPEDPKDSTVYIEHKKDIESGLDDKNKDNTDLRREVTRKITLSVPGLDDQTFDQTVTLYRDKTVDEALKAAGKTEAEYTSYSEWKPFYSNQTTNFDKFNVSTTTKDGKTVPIAAGYIPNGNGVTLKEENGDMYVPSASALDASGQPVANSEVHVTYNAKTGLTQKIEYVSVFEGDNNKVVGNQSVTGGKTGDEVKFITTGEAGKSQFKLVPPTGYKFANATVPGGFTFAPDADPIKIEVTHDIETISGNQKGHENETDISRHVTRTINVNIEGQDPTSYTQDLHFYRTKTVDKATNGVTYGEWKSNMSDNSTSFSDFQIPDDAGYEMTVTGGTAKKKNGKNYVLAQSGLSDKNEPVENITVTVDYKKANHTYTVNYEDKDGNKIGNPYVVSGKTGEHKDLDVPGHVPAGWKIVPNTSYDQSITFGSDSPASQTKTITVEHDTQHIDIDKNNKDTYREVTQVIYETLPGQTAGTKRIETIAFERDGEKDKVNGNIQWNNWIIVHTDKTQENGSQYTFGDYNINDVPAGYNVNVDGNQVTDNKVPAETIKAADSDSTKKVIEHHITFTPQDGINQEIHFISDFEGDNHKQIGDTQTVTGKADSKGTLISKGEPNSGQFLLNVPKGWKLVDPDFTQDFTFTPNAKAIDVHITHATHEVDKDNVPAGHDKSEFTKDITRTITVTKPGETKPEDHSQTITITRTGTLDEVTGKVTYNDWTNGNFTEYDAPTVDGYTPSQAKVDAENDVTDGYKDPNINITYMANDSHQTFHYVDENGKDTTGVADAQVPGKTDEQKYGSDVPVPDGWELVDTPNDFTIPAPEKDTPINVKIKHGKTEVTPENPKKPGDQIPGTKEQHFPSGVDENDLNKTISRTVTIVKPNGDKNSITQEISYKRTATVDNVTKKVTYGNWTPTDSSVTSFEGVTAPEISGYTADKTVAALTPDNEAITNWDNSKHNETIKYVAGNTSVSFKFVDDNDNEKQVGDIINLGGNTGETKNINLTVPEGYQLAKGQTLPTNYTFKDNNPEITIHLVHQTNTESGLDDKNKDNQDLRRKVTRTIVLSGLGDKDQTITQTVEMYRNKTTDEATGKATYTDWKSIYSNGSTSFDEYNLSQGKTSSGQVKEIKGYTPTSSDVQLLTKDNQTFVPSTSALSKDGQPIKDATIHVTYTANDHQLEIQYQDSDGKIIATQKFTGKTGEEITFSQNAEIGAITLEVPNGYELVPGTTIPHIVGVKGDDSENKPIIVHVKLIENPDDSDLNAPKGQDITVKTGEDPKAEDGISNKSELPSSTTYSWKDATPDTSTPGDKQGIVEVTYSDGSKDEVTVTVHVNEPSDAESHEPIPQVITVDPGQTPDPKSGIKNASDLDKITDPKNPDKHTSYEFKDGAPDTTTSGDKPVTIVVTYPDGSKDEVQTQVHVNEPAKPVDNDTDPVGQTIIVDPDQTPNPEDGIANKDKMPDGTKCSWKDGKTPDTSKSGDQDVTIVVTYPDGKTKEITTGLHVNTKTPEPIPTPTPQTDADIYEPVGQDVPTKQGEDPAAEAGIANKDQLPAGTTYTWQSTPDVSKPGNYPATIVVTYPDGSQDTVSIHVIVENPDPIGQDIDTDKGDLPDAGEGIANKDEMPDGTTYTWKHTPDVNKPGDHTATVVVTFPDGKTNEVEINITVKAENTKKPTTVSHKTKKSNKNKHWNDNFGVYSEIGMAGRRGNGNNAGAADTGNNGQNATNNESNAKTLPETGDSQSKLGLAGLALAGLAGIIGLAGDRKKKRR